MRFPGGNGYKRRPMRILDRYILRTFLTPFLACFTAFVMLYFLYDLFNNMDEFIEAKTPLREMGVYYLYLLPAVLKIILPVTLLLGVLYSLWQLTKSNEITAMRASGISLPRMVVPFVFVGLTCTGLVAWVEETIGPKAQEWTQMFIKSQNVKPGHDTRPAHIVGPLNYHNPVTMRTWIIEQMDMKSDTLEKVEISQERPNGFLYYTIKADSISWMDGKWVARNATYQYFDENGILTQIQDAAGTRAASAFYEWKELENFAETPKHLENEETPVEQLNSEELAEYIVYHPNMKLKRRAEIRTQLQMKRATPWICIVVTLLGIPFGNQTARKGAMAGIALCIGLFFLCYVGINIMSYLGKQGVVPPAVAAWVPLGFFSLVALVMTWRMR